MILRAWTENNSERVRSTFGHTGYAFFIVVPSYTFCPSTFFLYINQSDNDSLNGGDAVDND